MPPSTVPSLDRYRPLYAIGRGGMGVVEVALEQGDDGFERICALKRLLPEGARDKRHTDMFLREARLAALLSHPNVVHGFAFGETDGEFFLAMEYVEGEPLSRVLTTLREKKEKLSPALAAFVVAEVCEGLHAVHELKDDSGTSLQVVHRDVSPHNVMIAYEGGLKLLDFGVAKIEAEPGLTRTGEVKGKTAYMSPEQAMGETTLDRRSDLYSVGAVLFECVSGRKMWEGTEMEVLRHLALDEPPKLEEAVPDAPSELRAIYTRLVSKNAAGRPKSAHDVATELRRYADAHEGGDSAHLRALMSRLFSGEAVRRKTELERALAVTAPSEADVLAGDLRASLAPERRSQSDLAASVQSPPADREKKPFSRSTMIGVAVLAIAFTTVVGWRARGETAPSPITAAPETAAPATNPPPTTTASPPATTAPDPSAGPTATAVPTTAASTKLLPPSTPRGDATKMATPPSPAKSHD
ncbi:MAG: serine/threonine-protein kinase, partial [Polyangiaceae bacterium]